MSVTFESAWDQVSYILRIRAGLASPPATQLSVVFLPPLKELTEADPGCICAFISGLNY